MTAGERARKWLGHTQTGWEDSDDLETLTDALRAHAAEALREAACEAEALQYPHPKDVAATAGRSGFYQQNIKSAWRQAGHRVAKQLRARADAVERGDG
jgi:hypothetical protein